MAGCIYALAALVVQQTLLATPVVIQWEWQGDANFRKLSRVVLGLLTLAYVSVGFVWAVDALITELRQSIFLGGDYAAGAIQFKTRELPLTHPAVYVEFHNMRLEQFLPVILLAGIGGAQIVSQPNEIPPVGQLTLGLMITLTMPLAAQLYRYYFLLALVSAALLTAYGTDWFLIAQKSE